MNFTYGSLTFLFFFFFFFPRERLCWILFHLMSYKMLMTVLTRSSCPGEDGLTRSVFQTYWMYCICHCSKVVRTSSHQATCIQIFVLGSYLLYRREETLPSFDSGDRPLPFFSQKIRYWLCSLVIACGLFYLIVGFS